MSRNEATASACGKVILCGEHAVVYGRPAIALPLTHLRTTATVRVSPSHTAGQWEIVAPDIYTRFWRHENPDHPLAKIITLILARITPHTDDARSFQLHVTSELPVGAHLGSGAAASVACVRAIAEFFEAELSSETISDLAFEIEKIHHGTPSGVDNTVIAHEQPIWFVRERAPSFIHTQAQPALVIADTGIHTPTKISVGAVRAAWERNPSRSERLFDAIGDVVAQAREALQEAHWQRLGALMDKNHELLQQLGVSCKELDEMCFAALKAGALGAKLTGAGRGGNMIALAHDAAHAHELRHALLDAGAQRVF